MSSDFFAKLTNNIEGESKKEGHEKEIDILSWAWGVSNASGAGTGGGGGHGKATPSDLSFTHIFDKASPNLAKSCIKGTHIDELKLTARKSGDGQQDYVTITLTTAFITNVSVGGSGGGDLVETVSCACKKIKVEYKFQDEKGALKPGAEYTWDIEVDKVT
ncbi:Hcp family type VI secretion system effector [Variovorax sp. RT4R15]|uniref:Hcp family type VI secretion system effector n=1 Tax=Variovorax sp. RT4R15 TaxID=3443737 RepID=UPI003F488B69